MAAGTSPSQRHRIIDRLHAEALLLARILLLPFVPFRVGSEPGLGRAVARLATYAVEEPFFFERRGGFLKRRERIGVASKAANIFVGGDPKALGDSLRL